MALVVHIPFPLRGGLLAAGDVLYGSDEEFVRSQPALMRCCSPVADSVFRLPAARQPSKPTTAPPPQEAE